MKTKVIICPAYNTLHNELWYKWLEDNLVTRGYNAEVLDFPNTSSPSEIEWVETIKNANKGNQIILVGHSLGSRAVLAYLNQYKVKISIVILVASPVFWEGIVETRPPLKAYVNSMQKIDFPLVKNLIEKVYLFHGTNDHILSSKDIEYLKKVFEDKAQTYISETYGHYDVDKIPELLDVFPKK